MEVPEMSTEDVRLLLDESRNWSRWGVDDQRGTVNLITPDKRRQAAGLVRTGRTISLARPLPVAPAPNNAKPALHYMERRARAGDDPGAGIAADFIGTAPHGVASTHLDALCHVWDSHGMWNGRNPDEHVAFDGANWGGIEHWRDGIVTRGVLVDIPAFRGTEYVTVDAPVHGHELSAALAGQGTDIGPGDALIVHSGREAWDRNESPYGSGSSGLKGAPTGKEPRPGLHASCLEPIRDWDCSMLVWDMLDATPNAYGLPFTVHGAIFSYGLAVLDNALLEPLALSCRESGVYEFMLCVAPLWIEGGTASPVNPLAVL